MNPIKTLHISLCLMLISQLNANAGNDAPWKTPRDPVIAKMAPQVIESLSGSYRVRGPLRDGKAPEFLASLQADGTFPDLDPDDNHRALLRIWVIALDLGRKQALTPELRQKLYTALAHYTKLEAQNPAPWPIGCFHSPLYFLGTWFILEPDMSADWQSQPELRPTLKTIWEQGGIVASHAWNFPGGGTRVTDPLSIENFRHDGAFVVANFYPYRPLVAYALFLGRDDYLALTIETAKLSIDKPVNPADPALGFWTEGINPDSSVSAHGQQNYLFGYGKDYLSGLNKLANLTQDTPYAFEPEQLDVMAGIILDGMQWFVYHGQTDYSVLGRHNFYPDSGQGAEALLTNLSNALLKASTTPLAREAELKALVKRLGKGKSFAGSRYFWNVEDYVHRGEDYSIVVNVSSTRMPGPENTDRGRQNYHFGNGVSFIYLRGDEYKDARGGMNYRALPGITAAYGDPIAPFIMTWRGLRGRNTFSGGLNHEHSGIIAFESDLDAPHESVKAKKAWFFLGDIMVCLGTDIRADEDVADIQTTVNQTAWRTPVTLWEDGVEEPTEFEEAAEFPVALMTPAVLWQDGVGYVIAEGEASFTTQTVPTHWEELSRNNTANEPTSEADIFRLYFEHFDESLAHYAYAVHPAISLSEAAALVTSRTWDLLANTPQAQAIEFAEENWIGAVFYEATRVEASWVSLQTDSPIVVLVKRESDLSLTLVYEDPLRRIGAPAPQLSIQYGDSEEAEPFVIKLPLPQGLELGKPQTLRIPASKLAQGTP